MENKPMAVVKSPAKDRRFRKGSGFSLSEIKAAGKSVELLRELKVNVDYVRHSTHQANVDLLKELKAPEKKVKKKKSFVMKEKKPKTKPKVEKVIEAKKKAPKAKAAPKKTGKNLEKAEEPKVEVKKQGFSLTELAGLGPATAKKMIEIGVVDVEALCNEDPKELSALVTGCSEEKIASWILEGKKLLGKED